jgi:magnesium-transporting ATPase (P-type)
MTGKSIFHNIQNFLSFQLSTAAAALTLITLSTMFGLHNPLNAMQILFINILMDGESYGPIFGALLMLCLGPPSQSLGVDPVDHAVMRKPPRKKDEPVISKRILYRVLFSATIIVCGTLFIYMYALSDNDISRREQTMVRRQLSPSLRSTLTNWVHADVHLLCIPGPRLRAPEPQLGLRPDAKPDAHRHRVHILPLAARVYLFPAATGGLPDGGVAWP